MELESGVEVERRREEEMTTFSPLKTVWSDERLFPL